MLAGRLKLFYSTTRVNRWRAATVIGGSGGIGQAIVLCLAADGFGVSYARDAAKAQATVAAIRADGGKAIAGRPSA